MNNSKTLKKTILSASEKIGVFDVVKYLTRKKPLILMYHRFTDKHDGRAINISVFEKQIKYLKQNYNIVSLDKLITDWSNGDEIKDNSVIITVDDGYHDFYTHAFPILKKYNAPATLYLTYEFANEKIWMWPDIIEYIMASSKFKKFELVLNDKTFKFDITNTQGKAYAWNCIADYCLTLTESNKLEFIHNLSNELSVNIENNPPDKYKSISWGNVYEMLKYDIEIGGHTMTHPKLTKLDDAELIYEIVTARELMQNKTQKEIKSFAYPNGTREDFNENIKNVVKKAGFTSATVGYHDGAIYDDIYELGRYSIDDDMNQFNKTVHGIEYFVTRFR